MIHGQVLYQGVLDIWRMTYVPCRICEKSDKDYNAKRYQHGDQSRSEILLPNGPIPLGPKPKTTRLVLPSDFTSVQRLCSRELINGSVDGLLDILVRLRARAFAVAMRIGSVIFQIYSLHEFENSPLESNTKPQPIPCTNHGPSWS